MTIDEAKSFLDRKTAGDIFVVAAISVSDDLSGPVMKLAIPSGYCPIRMYAWLQMLENDMEAIRNELLADIQKKDRKRFIAVVKRLIEQTIAYEKERDSSLPE
ncbi:MAG: hypothetical protein WCI73_00550 [Phycisphaerae bacterium]